MSKNILSAWTVGLFSFLIAIPLFIASAPASASMQYAFMKCESAYGYPGTWCRTTVPWYEQFGGYSRRDGQNGPYGATLNYIQSIVEGAGYVPAGVTYVTPTLQVCSGGIGGDCRSGQSTRQVAEGVGWSCTGGEPWSACLGRAVGSPAVLEGAFIGNENGACLILRDQNGGEWSTDYYGYACGKAKTPPTTPDSCVVTTSDQWDIAFGNLERTEISASSASEKTKALTLSCMGPTPHDFSVKLNMTPTSWSTSQLVTNNPDLGVQVTVDGTAAKLGDSFTMKVTSGTASKTLGFSVLRNPATKALDIATGDFSASGTLVVSEL